MKVQSVTLAQRQSHFRMQVLPSLAHQAGTKHNLFINY